MKKTTNENYNYSNAGIQNLRIAIAEQALADYKDALSRKRYVDAMGRIQELRRFFASEYGKWVMGNEIDVKQLECAVKQMLAYDEWRRARKCKYCKFGECPHHAVKKTNYRDRYEMLAKKTIICLKEEEANKKA